MFGRGVIGALYGWALERAGHHVEFYVRPGRAETYGKVIELDLLDARRRPWGKQVTETWPVRYRESLEPDHDFDLIVVSVQHWSFAQVAAFLGPRVGGATVLVFNNLWVEPPAAVEDLPAEQVAWGFPGAGGGFGDDGVLHGALLPLVFFGTLDRPLTERERAVRQVFREAGFRIQENSDFRGWLLVHFAQNAGLHTQSLKRGSLAGMSTGEVREAILATRELLPLLEARGVDLRRHRGELRPFTAPLALTAPALAWAFRRFPPARRVTEAHANPEELRAVCRDTLAEARRLGVDVPRLEAAEPYFATDSRPGTGTQPAATDGRRPEAR
jgi:2-dehydropantoate 2-reductase